MMKNYKQPRLQQNINHMLIAAQTVLTIQVIQAVESGLHKAEPDNLISRNYLQVNHGKGS